MTTTGLSSQLTVHKPSVAWNTITASVIVASRAKSLFDQRQADQQHERSFDGLVCAEPFNCDLAE